MEHQRYVWDDAKRIYNLAKHEIDFEEADDFDWDTATIIPSERDGEQRFIAYGYIGSRMYALVYADRDDRRRIISLRKANRREVRRYA